MRVAALAVIALAMCVAWPTIGRVAQIDDLLAEADLRSDASSRKPEGASWGTIFRELFRNIPIERSSFDKSYAL